MIRVLTVDRDPLAASLHCEYINAIDGFLACDAASTSAEALALARLHRPDIVLLDLSLDHAKTLLRRLQPARIVGVTSTSRAPDLLALRRLVSTYLFKPFLFEAFSALIQQCAPARRRRR